MRGRRFYTQESYRLMERVRLVILVLTSPAWLPLYFWIVLADKLEDLLDILDGILQKVLDKIIPQIK